MENEELMTLRGGYKFPGVSIKCTGPGVECSGFIENGSCALVAYYCDNMMFCDNWESAICVG
jgi:hypothetical protein